MENISKLAFKPLTATDNPPTVAADFLINPLRLIVAILFVSYPITFSTVSDTFIITALDFRKGLHEENLFQFIM
jgi:hypothetical protein